jgi:hypothetical protein
MEELSDATGDHRNSDHQVHNPAKVKEHQSGMLLLKWQRVCAPAADGARQAIE